MFTPQLSATDASSPRRIPSTPTPYERVLGVVLAGTLAAVASVALLLPTGSTTTDDGGGPAVSAGPHARGKATVPSWSAGQSVPGPSSRL